MQASLAPPPPVSTSVQSLASTISSKGKGKDKGKAAGPRDADIVRDKDGKEIPLFEPGFHYKNRLVHIKDFSFDSSRVGLALVEGLRLPLDTARSEKWNDKDLLLNVSHAIITSLHYSVS